ncbi:MAG: type II toxin-antitoxin system VapC family toxin [Chloroflexi bacterium]|nr:type II toxin-antitoxin system VapC family toxin [Chloroflexota bacterium]
MSDYLLDTNILVLAIRSRPSALDFLEMLHDRNLTGYISVVTRAEIFAGMRPTEEQRTIDLLDLLVSLLVNAAVADRAGRLIYQYARKGVALALPDTLIAATALVHSLILATTNVRHFPFPELEIYPLT